MLGEPSATHIAADGTLPAAAVRTRVGTLRARLAGLLSDSIHEREWLAEALRLFREMSATGHAERTTALLNEASQ